ncbi:MAG TPA: mandelate racemase/muconate lactonizing enzyme family protein [Opitutaceae bacterium]|nr:mandelate racemase/muconate lactonizing enzyme family protein [Opitutaceae bacterium]
MASHPRRQFLKTSGATLAGMAMWPQLSAAAEASAKIKLTRVELIPVRATGRTVWLFVRLHTDAGLTGLGEASDAFGFLNTTREDAARMTGELNAFFALVQGRSPLEINLYREAGLARASGGLIPATAYSAIEQALWDLAGKILGQPTYNLIGGSVRTRLPVYANINRASQPRAPAGFAAAAKRATGEGFRALKLAPFDGFKRGAFAAPAKSKPIADGIACIAAVRDAVGDKVGIMVDAHSLFDVPLSIEVARQLEPFGLTWYEEPVAPEMVEETAAIRRAIKQPMAGGELLFQMKGFAALCRSKAVEVIMPDVKHCGGLLELTHIAAMANVEGVAVAPHNPSGPVSTAASIQVCAGMKNFNLLELQWGEVPWRGEMVVPPETFVNGEIAVPTAPGIGVTLNDALARKYAL